ncbi:MAG: Ni/Fe hydrogenase subunit alpha [Desulfuromonadales bacterium]|nr:Ni/Fe hydrogenase subunit alpha [Desulfuromonadales bacterium]
MNITVPYLSRIEGHAHLVVDVAAREVVACRLDVIETPRLFEQLLVGRHYSEVAGLAARICGVCSHSHNLVSLMATERALGIQVSEQSLALRRLLMCGEILQSHLLHLYFMAVPDYLGVPSLLALTRDRRELVGRALRLKKLGSQLCAAIGGRPVHPVTTCVGGFLRLPVAAELQELRRQLARALPDLEQTVELLAGLDWPDFERESECLALHDPHGYPLFGETLISSAGLQVPVERYSELISEYTVRHATARHARARTDSYLVGPLARLRQGYHHLSPLARDVAALLNLSPRTANPYLAQAARMVEVLQVVEQAMHLIDELLLAGLHTETLGPPRRCGTGAAALEAPRGLLIHAYRYAEDGTLLEADCVIPTAQNLANLEADLRARVPQIIDCAEPLFQSDLERLVRSYDPCLSCATHLLTIERR